MSDNPDTQPKPPQETKNVKVHFESKAPPQFQGDQFPMHNYIWKTETKTLETTHAQLHHPFKGYSEVYSVNDPSHSRWVQVDMVHGSIYAVEGETSHSIRPKDKQVIEEIKNAFERAYSNDILVVNEANGLIALREVVLKASADGKFTPAEENAIITAAKKITPSGNQK